MTTTFAPTLSQAVSPSTTTETTETAETADTTEPSVRARYVSIYASSIFAVTLLFFVGVGLPCWLFLDSLPAGLGLGAMCAIWGGPSFGVMTASARVSAWHEAEGLDF